MNPITIFGLALAALGGVLTVKGLKSGTGAKGAKLKKQKRAAQNAPDDEGQAREENRNTGSGGTANADSVESGDTATLDTADDSDAGQADTDILNVDD